MHVDITDKQIRNHDFCLLENSLSPDRSSHLFVQAKSEFVVHTAKDFTCLFTAIESAQKNNLFAGIGLDQKEIQTIDEEDNNDNNNKEEEVK